MSMIITGGFAPSMGQTRRYIEGIYERLAMGACVYSFFDLASKQIYRCPELFTSTSINAE